MGLFMPHQGSLALAPILQVWTLRLQEVKALELNLVIPDFRVHILSMALEATSPKPLGKMEQ